MGGGPSPAYEILRSQLYSDSKEIEQEASDVATLFIFFLEGKHSIAAERLPLRKK